MIRPLVEAAKMPQLNETERALMALLQQEKQRNSSAQPPVGPTLPDLDPMLFQSAKAQSELAAVGSLNLATHTQVLTPPEPVEAVAVSDIPLTGPLPAAEESGMFDTGWDLTDEDFAATGPARLEPQDTSLENIFMARAQQEIGGGSDRAAQRRAERLGQDYDPLAIDMSVLRGPRQATGGVVVSQRGPNGFAPLPRPAPPTRHVATRPAATPPAPSPKSRFERLLGKSIID